MTVRFDVYVERAELVATQGVGAALQHDGAGVVCVYDGPCDVFKQPLPLNVIDAVLQWNIECVVGAWVFFLGTGVIHRSSPWEEANLGSEFVDGKRDDPVCGVEGLLDTITMVNVDIDV